MGYRKKGSKASLKASGTVAALLLAAGYLMGGPYATAGLVIALGARTCSCTTHADIQLDVLHARLSLSYAFLHCHQQKAELYILLISS